MTKEELRMVGAREIGLMLGGLSRQRVGQITARPGFPRPVIVLMQGKIWLTDEVDEWIAANRS